MKTVIHKLVRLADVLDSIGYGKQADKLDHLIKAANGKEDFGDLLLLFDKPAELEDRYEDSPSNHLTDIEEETSVDPFGDVLPADESKQLRNEQGEGRLGDIKRRHELMKLKKQLEELDSAESGDMPSPKEDEMENVDLDAAFEDEEDVENNIDDKELEDKIKEKPGAMDKVIDFLKENPALLEQLLMMLV